MPSPVRPKLLDSRSLIRKQVERCEGKVRLGEHGYNGTPSTNQGTGVMTT